MIENGLTNDDLEKALREEEVNIANQEQTEGTEEANESITEAKIEELTKEIESKAESIEKDLAEVGGDEGIKKTLEGMAADKKKELADKIDSLSKRITRQKEYAKDELIFAIPFSDIADPADDVLMEIVWSLAGVKTMIGITGAIEEFSKMLSAKKERRALIKEQKRLNVA